jgi:hypothetical protein
MNNLAQDIRTNESLVDYVARTGDVEPLKAVDAWVWAFENKIKLTDGIFDERQYQKEIMEDDSRVQVFRKCRQIGGTQVAILKAFHNLINKIYPKGIIYLFPTKDTVTDFSTTRFKPLISENWNTIGQYVKDTDRANLKRIQDAHIFFRSGRLGQVIEGQVRTSASHVGISADEIIFDEWDLMDQKGQEIVLGCMADSDFQRETYLSNPTMPDYGIDFLYQESDQRVWMTRCRHCSECTCLGLEFMDSPERVLKRQHDGSVIRACKKCGKEIYPDDGFWEAQKASNKGIVGRWISHLSIPKVDVRALLDKWEDPNTDKGNFLRMKMGLPYIEAEYRLTKNDLYQCIGPDMMWHHHKGPCAMGIDVGSKILHVVIMDKPNENVCRVVYAGRFNEFEEIHDLAKHFNIACCVIDENTERRKAREFGDKEPYMTYLCRYLTGPEKYTNWNAREKLVKVHRTEVCDETHNLVVTPGRLILPRINSEIEEYIFEMTNIAKSKEVDELTGDVTMKYIRLKSDDHYRHATNYAWLASTQVGLSKEGTRDLDYGVRRKKRNWMLA